MNTIFHNLIFFFSIYNKRAQEMQFLKLKLKAKYCKPQVTTSHSSPWQKYWREDIYHFHESNALLYSSTKWYLHEAIQGTLLFNLSRKWSQRN